MEVVVEEGREAATGKRVAEGGGKQKQKQEQKE